ncbi:MAG: NosD domain-containing protein [Promethearchaeota archaeon]
MLSRKRLTVYLFIMAFLFNIGIGFTYLIHDEKNPSETVGNILTQPKMSTDHLEISINSDSELDAFCAGNGTTGTSWETAHVIENYEINGTVGDGISIKNTRRFLIINNCIISNSSSSGISIDNCTNIRIQNSISESNPSAGVKILNSKGIFINSTDFIDNQEGLEMLNTNNTEIINSYFTQNYEDAIYIDSNCHNILFLENSIIENSYGFYIFESSSIRYIDNDIINNTGTGIYTELNIGDNFTGNVISNNEGTGLELYDCSSSIVENNIIKNNTGTGIHTELNFGDTITGNIITNNEGTGLELYECNSTIVENNTVMYSGGDGIYTEKCNSTIVENNIVMYNDYDGIEMWGGFGGNYNTISNNTFSNNTEYGILLDDSNQHNIITNNEVCFNEMSGIYITDEQHNNTISYNNIANNTNYGIWVERDSDNSTILGNTIKNNGDNGIYIDQFCNNNTIIYNTITGNPSGIEIYDNEKNAVIGNDISFNDDYGIILYDCYYTPIFGNNISFNKYGIEFDDGSYFNQIWMNIISDNSEYQGFEDGVSNNWDNGKVGNYWGDYNERYPGAIAIGNIWDTNYTINGTSNFNDTKPLVNIDPVLDLLPSPNITYMMGETGHFVSWMITDTYYWNSEYFIYRDDVLVNTGEWVSGDAASVNVDGLEFGTYLFNIVAKDGTAWGKNELTIEVIVWAIPEPPVFITPSQTINSANITIQWAAANFTEFYNIYINNAYAGNTTTTNYTLEFDFNGDYLIEITAQNVYGVSNRSLSILIIVDDPNLEGSDNYFWYLFGGGWILVAGFIGVAFVKVKLKK